MPPSAVLSVPKHTYINLHLSVTPSRQTSPLLWSYLTLVLSLMLLTGLTGCGPASSDNAPNLGPRSGTGGLSPSKQDSPTGFASGVGTSGGGTSGQGGKIQPQPGGAPTQKTGGQDQPAVPSTPDIPDAVVRDLGSPDVRTRLQALNHWMGQNTTIPLDPVFEALEDEDEAVQAKATEIIEQRFAAEQALERN